MKLPRIIPFATLLFLLSFTLNIAHAEDPNAPPAIPDDKTPWTLKVSPVRDVHLGNLTVQLEKTTLDDVQKIAGVGNIRSNEKDAGDAESWLCYTISTHDGSERIWFSSSEIGGEEDILTFDAKIGVKPTVASKDCPELPAKLRPVRLANSLWLGSTMTQVRSSLGKPSGKKGRWWIYSYLGENLGKSPKQYDVFAQLYIEFDNGIVVGISESEVSET